MKYIIHLIISFAKVVGEAERKLASLFEAARAIAPCFLLLDNIDIILGGVDSENHLEELVDKRDDLSSSGPDAKADRRPSGKQRPIRSNRTSSVVFDRLLSTLLVEIDGIGKSYVSGSDYSHVKVDFPVRSAPVVVIATATNPILLDRCADFACKHN